MQNLLTLNKEGSDEFTEKKSKFIGYAKHVASEADASAFIAKIKAKHWDAKHNVYAYVLGENSETQRSTDDGEPSGTAGRPVLEIIKGENLTNTVVVVTRYFGGVLLGTGGLVRAYSKAAKLAIANSQKVQRIKANKIAISADYDMIGKIQNFLIQKGYQIDDIEYKNSAVIHCVLKVTEVADFPGILAQQFQMEIDCVVLNKEHWFYEPVD